MRWPRQRWEQRIEDTHERRMDRLLLLSLSENFSLVIGPHWYVLLKRLRAYWTLQNTHCLCHVGLSCDMFATVGTNKCMHPVANLYEGRICADRGRYYLELSNHAQIVSRATDTTKKLIYVWISLCEYTWKYFSLHSKSAAEDVSLGWWERSLPNPSSISNITRGWDFFLSFPSETQFAPS